MTGLRPALLVLASSLGIITAVVTAGDRGLFVPPPESVAEGFVRQLAAGRYDRAIPLLSRNAAAQTDVSRLEALARDLERAVGGVIEQVEGEPQQMEGHIAQASARIRGRGRAESIITFALVRERGLWRIDGWGRR
jgi:hypothetical protein